MQCEVISTFLPSHHHIRPAGNNSNIRGRNKEIHQNTSNNAQCICIWPRGRPYWFETYNLPLKIKYSETILLLFGNNLKIHFLVSDSCLGVECS